MVKLIKYFNEKYGNEYGNIDYPRTTAQMYQAYQIIKSYSIQDYKLLGLLNDVVLPKPKTVKEKEMFSECLYEVSNNGVLLNDLIYKKTPFLKLTKDDFEEAQIEMPLSEITEQDVTSMDEPVSRRIYLYELAPKLDWINNEADFEKIGYTLKIKTSERENMVNELIFPFNTYPIENNVITYTSNVLGIINNGYYDYKNHNVKEKNCFYVEIRNVPDSMTDFELELFKIDSIPTLTDINDAAYSLVIGMDGKLYKRMRNQPD